MYNRFLSRIEERQSQVRANLKTPRKYTKPEMILQSICKDEGIEFTTQKAIKLQYYDWHKRIRTQVDVFIDSTEPNTCLYADGNAVHANPNRYRTSSVSLHAGYKPDDSYVLAKNNVKYKTNKDKTDQDYAITRDLESQGYTVLRFWASDLLYDKEKCRQEIIDVVRKSLGVD